MGELRLSIDARPARVGANEFVSATRDVARGAKEAAGATREADAAMRATVPSSRALTTTSREYTKQLEFEKSLIGLTTRERDVAIVKREAERRAIQNGIRDVQGYVRAQEQVYRAQQQVNSLARSSGGGFAQFSALFGSAGADVANFVGQVQTGVSALDSIGLSARLGTGPVLAISGALAGIGAAAAGLTYASGEAAALERRFVGLSAGARDAVDAIQRVREAERTSRRVAGATGIDAGELAAPLVASQRSGYSKDEQRAALFTAAQLQLLDQASAEQSFKTVNDILDAYKRGASEFTATADELFAASTVGTAGFAALGDAAVKLGPRALELGVPFKDVATYLALASKNAQGFPGAVGGLERLLGNIAERSSDASLALQSLGVDASPEAIRTDGLLALVADIKRVSDGRPDLVTLLFGDKASGRAAIAVLSEAGEAALKTREQIDSATGSIGTAARRAGGLPSAQVDQVQEQVAELVGGVGDGTNSLLAKIFGSPKIGEVEVKPEPFIALRKKLRDAILQGKDADAAEIANELRGMIDTAFNDLLSKSAAPPDLVRKFAQDRIKQFASGLVSGVNLQEYNARNDVGIDVSADRTKQINADLQRDFLATRDPLVEINNVLKEIRVNGQGATTAIKEFVQVDGGQIQAVLRDAADAKPIEFPLSPDARKLKNALTDTIDDVTKELARGTAAPLRFDAEVAIKVAPDDVQQAFARVKSLIATKDFAFPTPLKSAELDDVEILRDYATALDQTNTKAEAAQRALDEFEAKLALQAQTVGKSGRALEELRATQEALRILTQLNGKASIEQAEAYGKLAGAAYDLAEAEKRRARAIADSKEGAANYDALIDSLREQIRLAGLSVEQIEEENVVQKARGFLLAEAAGSADALAAAAKGIPFDAQFAPVEGRSVDVVRAMVRELQDLRRVSTDISEFGPFRGDYKFAPLPEPLDLSRPSEGDNGRPRSTEERGAYARSLDGLIARMQFERELIGKTNEERERSAYLRDVESAAIDEGRNNVAALVEQYGREYEALQKAQRLDRLGFDVGSTIADSFEQAIFSARNLREAVNALGRDLAQLAFRAAVTEPLGGALGRGASSLFSGLFGTTTPVASAMGNVFDGGHVVPFATGGALDRNKIYRSATHFPLAGGQTGLLGERGPEAITPLHFGPEGLGIRNYGGGSGGSESVDQSSYTVNITQNFYGKQDNDGMKRSARQAADTVKRTLGRGRG